MRKLGKAMQYQDEINEQKEYFTIEFEIPIKNQIEILLLKNSQDEMKNALEIKQVTSLIHIVVQWIPVQHGMKSYPPFKNKK